MSVEFEIRGSARKLGRFDDRITVWRSTVDGPLIALSSEDEDFTWFFAPGRSLRGFSVRYTRKFFRASIDLRLSACASRGDWQLAASFLALALERGARVTEEKRRVASRELLPQAINERARATFQADIGLLRRIVQDSAEDHMTLPNQWFSAIVKKDDLAADSEALHDALIARTAKYAAARQASVITTRAGTTAILWGGEELVAPRTDLLIFPETRENPDIDDYLYVEWQDGLAEAIPGQMPACHFRADSADALWPQLVASGRPIRELSP